MEMEISGAIVVMNEVTKTRFVYEQVIDNRGFAPISDGVYKFLVDERDIIVNSRHISYEEFSNDIAIYKEQPWCIVVDEVIEGIEVPFKLTKSHEDKPLSVKYQFREIIGHI